MSRMLIVCWIRLGFEMVGVKGIFWGLEKMLRDCKCYLTLAFFWQMASHGMFLFLSWLEWVVLQKFLGLMGGEGLMFDTGRIDIGDEGFDSLYWILSSFCCVWWV